MPNNPISMNRLRQILRLHEQGKSHHEISRMTGSSRNTIRRYLRIFRSEALSFEAVEQMNNHQLSLVFQLQETHRENVKTEQLVAMMPGIEKILRRKGGTRLYAWKDFYLVKHPEGFRFTQFCAYLNKWMNRAKPVMHLEHKAGDKMYVDFAGEKLEVVDRESGEVKPAEVFVAILGCSQLTYVCAVSSQNRYDFIRGCERALRFFDGVPAAIVPDNLKSAVTKSSRFEPTINEMFEDFALHYDTAVLPARVYRPRDKALVEGAVKIMYRRMYVRLREQTFFTLEELNAAIGKLLEEHNNALLTGRTQSRRQQFEELERSALRPLPVHRYSFKQIRMVTAIKNGHVCLADNKHYYSIPYQFIGKKLKLIYNDELVEVYDRYDCIATHRRSYQRFRYTTDPNHLASTHRFQTELNAALLIAQGNEVSEEVGAYLSRVIEQKTHPEQGYKSCQGILFLRKKIGDRRLILACRRAMQYQLFGYKQILNIVERGLDQLSEEEPETAASAAAHPNLRGSGYYH